MKKSAQVIALMYLGFGLFLGASGIAFSYGLPKLSTIISYLGFAIPLIAFVAYVRRQNGDVRIPMLDNKEGFFLSLPFVFISLICVMGISL